MKIPDLTAPKNAKVDILIRAKNGPQLTLDCILSIRKWTPSTLYRLILVDDGSDPPLSSAIVANVDLLIRHAQCKGSVSATNAGLAVSLLDSSAQYVLVLDNDTQIPENDTTWLARMIAELEQGGPLCAAVGATTSFANPPQHILAAPVTYTHDWKDEEAQRGGWKENPPSPWFVSFAVLLRKDVIRHVGFWDEQFNPGNYEDTDYALQLRTLGYEIRVARSVYIHHVGHQTYREEMQTLMDTNGRKFRLKWGVGRLFDLGLVTRDQLKVALG